MPARRAPGRSSSAGGTTLVATGIAARLLLAPSPVAAAETAFRPTTRLQLGDLETLVARAAPDIEAARLQVDLARADVVQSHLLSNPDLDVQWGTIPIGRLNPPGLQRPLANVPNYGVGVSYTFPVGKRRPRQQQAAAIERGTRAELQATVRAQAFELAEVLGDLATATLRVHGFEQMVEDAERSVAAAQTRVELSFGVPLDVDRLRIELGRTERLLSTARSDVRASLAACAAYVGMPCTEFGDSEQARAWLQRWIDASLPDPEGLADRPDLRALAEYADAAHAETKLARRQKIPDPTVRLGYLHDRFIVAGNQRNSLFVSVGVPLPLFDRGQAQRQAAEARARRLDAERAKREAVVRAQVPALRERVAVARERQTKLRSETIPAALAVADELERAAEKRLTSITEMVQARRTLRELVLEEADAYADAYRASLGLFRILPPTTGELR